MEKNYALFAQVYDAIMDDSLYEKWYDFSVRHFSPYTHKILELACGTGILTEKFVSEHYELTGLDLSPEMLELAKTRVSNADFELGDMRKLDFKADFDAVTCFSDSLCYLADEDELKATFAGVYRGLREGGTFIFDVHSTYQTDEVFPGHAYHDNAEDFAFVWDTYAGEVPHSVAHELTFFVKEEDGRFMRKDELHEERTYPIEVYRSLLEEVGFKDVQVFADFEDEAPGPESLRWFFVAKG
ncbi:class I SAM-dependent DNA methyltransferase [Lactococcus termiticola]|uniref:class I SAM-dependent DNA methyltransferase n=1 Tax=Lactococcus termiticola TaxID=2169526 RepID=UPI0027395E3D|nr:class I SAM-dependent methyltransferase [Lactococcus termiticola]